MAKVTAPLLGFSAHGSIGKTLVYGKWKGIPYTRQHVIPANPRSTAQTSTRDVFSFLSSVWKVAPADLRTAYSAAVKGQPLTNRNKFMGDNTKILRPLTVLTGMELSPGAAGGLPVDPTITGAAGQITIAGVAPAVLPSGWSILRWIGAAIRQQDAHVGTMFDIAAGDDDTSPYAVVLTGLAAGNWVAGGWFEYQRSSLASDLAYGASFAAATVVS